MKTENYLLFITLSTLLLWLSCAGDDPVDTPKIHFENSSLEVKVRAETDTGVVRISGATVSLYDNLNDRDDEFKLVYVGTTNEEGIVAFTALAKEAYWISVKSPIDGQVQLFHDQSPFPTPGPPVVLNRLDVLFRK